MVEFIGNLFICFLMLAAMSLIGFGLWRLFTSSRKGWW